MSALTKSILENVRAGLLLPEEVIDNAKDVKSVRELSNEEKEFLESSEWTDLSYTLNKIKELDTKVSEAKESIKSIVNNFIQENDLNSLVEPDYRGLDEEVDKLIEGIKLDLKVEIGKKQEEEEDLNGENQ